MLRKYFSWKTAVTESLTLLAVTVFGSKQTGEGKTIALLSISKYCEPRKRRSLVCSEVLASGLQCLCVGERTPRLSFWPLF